MKNITSTVFVIPMLILFGSVRAFIEPSSFSINSHKTENMMDLPLRAHGDDENQDSDFKKWKKTRMARLDGNDDKFVTGEELRNLRLDLESLRQNIQWAEALKDETRIESLAKAIKEGESRDPDFMYRKALKILEQAQKMKDLSKEERNTLTEKWEKIAESARQYVQHYNLDGLWVGSYGSHGTQLVNITYVGDTLVATKATGDRNVPRGEVSFTVCLSPEKASALPPFQFSSKHQGDGEYQRFPGRGQVSRKGFKDHRFVEGQMIMFEDKFSFVWVPTKHQVLFTRPSPETTLRLLRDTISKEDEIENMRDHIACCFDMDMTTCIARQQDSANFEPLRRISLQEDLDNAEKLLAKQKERSLLFQLNKWRKYIDQALDK